MQHVLVINLYISSLKALLPWVFAYDRINYSWYMTVFISDMNELPTKYPEVYEEFLKGRFTVQMKTKNAFGRNELDKCIENTINKDTKTPGGLTRFSTNSGASD